MQVDKRGEAITCLLAAIDDTQQTIRAYDMKANSMGVLLTVALGITNFTLLQPGDFVGTGLVVSWVLGLFALGALIIVLHPLSNPFEGIELGGYSPYSTFYLHKIKKKPGATVAALAERALDADWVTELTYENMKVSCIRDYKHTAFMWALIFSVLTLMAIGCAVISRG